MPTPIRSGKRDENRDEGDPFRDLFKDFEKDFAQMQEQLNAIMQDAVKQLTEQGFGKAGQPGSPFVYGFSMRLGPDGKPRFEQFGNTLHAPGAKPEVAVEGGREPLTDVLDHEDSITVTVELPGVEKTDIQVYATEQQLTIKVDTATRKYYKELALPAAVKPDSTQATFKNGVLDVTIQKQERSPPAQGRRVDVT